MIDKDLLDNTEESFRVDSFKFLEGSIEDFLDFASGFNDLRNDLLFKNPNMKEFYLLDNNLEFSIGSTKAVTSSSNNSLISFSKYEKSIQNIYSNPLLDRYNNHNITYLNFFKFETSTNENNDSSENITFQYSPTEINQKNLKKRVDQIFDRDQENTKDCISIYIDFDDETSKGNELKLDGKIPKTFLFEIHKCSKNNFCIMCTSEAKYGRCDLILRKIRTNCLKFISDLIECKNLFSSEIKEGKTNNQKEFNNKNIYTIISEALKEKNKIKYKDPKENERYKISLKKSEAKFELMDTSILIKSFNEFYNENYLGSKHYNKKLKEIEKKYANSKDYIRRYKSLSENYVNYYKKAIGNKQREDQDVKCSIKIEKSN